MKKLFVVLFLGMMIVGFMTSCSTNSPSGVVKKQMECLKNKDAKGLVELIDLSDVTESEEELEKGKAELASMIESKGFKTVEKKGGIKSYEILDEDVAENPEPGSLAIVTIKTVYNNGEEETEKVKLIMDNDKNWKMSLKK